MATNISYPARAIPIPEWSVSERPREKYLAQGADHVGDAELLAILLRTGSARESAVDLAKRILASSNNSLNRLSDMSVAELTKVNGIGPVKAVTLHAAFELGRRRRAEVVEQQKKIMSLDDVIELMQPRLAELKHEQFWVIFVNMDNVILKIQQISSGGIAQTGVDVRRIIRQALELGATGMFLCHNHPSGNVKPSNPDIELTLSIKNAANLFNIKVIDHVVLNRNDAYSFSANALLV